MSENNHNHPSLYDDSDYPSRRQPTGRPEEGERPPRRPRRKRRRAGNTALKVLGTLLLVGLCTGALLCCFAAVYINRVIVPLADLSLDDFAYGENSVMYYEDKATGQYVEMTTLLSTTKSEWVDLEEMPDDLINAAVAIEDRHFWTHSGVDWGRTARAVLSMFTGGDIQGGSTITQQMLKNLTDYNEVTVKRKITEIVRALRFTQNNSKEDTIEMYLNIIPLGSGCEGVGSASYEYFGKPVSELTLAECASLIAITNNPSLYGPYSVSKVATSTGEIWDARQWNKWRQEIILEQMLEQGMISQAQHDEAVAQELVFVGVGGGDSQTASQDIYTWYEETVISDVRQALKDQLGWSDSAIDLAFQQGGLRIYTCYDPDVQAAVDAVYTNRDNLNYTSRDGQLMQSAITVIDNASGDVVAIAGQFGEKEGNLLSNYANSSKRQPGSSIKPLSVYAPALEMGKISPITVLDDYPYQSNGGSPWPYNAGTTRYRGLTNIPYALKVSLNTIAVRIVADLVTPEESFRFMEERFHFDLEEGREINGKVYSDVGVSPMAMGGLTDGVTTRDMAEAYAAFPNGGTYTVSRTFTRVTRLVDGEEVLLLDNPTQQEQAIKPQTAYYMNELLQGVFQSGGTAAGRGLSGMHCAGKTGTTNDVYDLWFVGYTPYYTAAVWMGYPQNATMPNTTTHVGLWNMVMSQVHEGLSDQDFPDPGGRRTVRYCLDSGLPASEYCEMDPRGNRVVTASVFPEDYPEGKVCTAHTAASVVTICVDDPVLDEEGNQTGLYHEAGPTCLEASLRQVCYPDYERASVAGVVAADEQYRYATAIQIGLCTVHGGETPLDPDDPNMTLDPDDPDYGDPNGTGEPVLPGDPVFPGGEGETGGGTGEPAGPEQPESPPSQDIPRPENGT